MLASRCLLLGCLVPVVLLPLAAQEPRFTGKPEGRKYALVVGVKKYRKDELSDLKYTENDAADLAQLLQKSGYHRVVLMTQRAANDNPELQPTADNLRDNLRGLLENREPDDLVVVALSGHGVQFKNDQEHYFCPMDARLSDS